MSEIINVKIAEISVGRNNGLRFKTGSIGSCVIIILYDKKTKTGGLAHAVLPQRHEPKKDQIIESPAKYVCEAIDNLVSEIKKLGSEKKNLRAKLVGGARMFKILSGDKYGIGYQNIETAKNKLKESNILIAQEDTGGNTGRTLEFNLENGLVKIIKNL